MALSEKMTHIPGEDKGDVTLYALSTCGWCRKTKGLLSDLNVSHRYVDVDLLQGSERQEALGEVGKWNPNKSFPTLVINDRCIIGFREEEIRGALGHGSR